MSATLLLADDSITIQRVIELTFADEDIRVVVAGDGQQAIQKIESERPDIVLADVGMPRLDGYAVATHVKQSPALKHIPVLLLTGAFEPIDEARARHTGCDGVLVKPFEPQKLVAQVKELLRGAHSQALWPAEMPRAQVEQVERVEPVQAIEQPAPVVIEEAPAPRTMPELLRAEQQEVAAPPLSVPAVDPQFDIDPVIDPVFDLSEAELSPATSAEQSEGDDVPNRNDSLPRHARPELPPPADHFESELDMLDAALSRLDPTAHAHELDEATASEFARDLNDLRHDTRTEDANVRPAPPSFGNWDLPRPSQQVESNERRPIDVVAEEIPLQAAPAFAEASAGKPPAPVAPPVQTSAPIQSPAPIAQPPVVPPAIETPAPVIQPTIAAAAPAPPTPSAPSLPTPPAHPQAPIERPTLAAAFSALLAAEKSRPAAQAAAPQISEAAIEAVVKRVLARMAGDTVNRVVLETAERLIREEISRTKDPSGR